MSEDAVEQNVNQETGELLDATPEVVREEVKEKAPRKKKDDGDTPMPKKVGVAYQGKFLDNDSFAVATAARDDTINWGGPPSRRPEYMEAKLNESIPTGDYENMQQLNRAINQLRIDNYKAKAALDQSQREAVEAKAAYKRAYNVAFVGLSGDTESRRKAIAELMSQVEYNAMVVADTKYEAMKDMCWRLRDDMESLRTLSANLRAEVNLR